MSKRHRDKQGAPQTLIPSLELSVQARPLDVVVPEQCLASPPADPAAQTSLHETDLAKQPDQPRRKLRSARANDIVGDRYIVEGTIGRGGMGRVLRVRHQALGKRFALKLIKIPIAHSPRIREMFYREARLASALSHDNICTVVDFGEDETFGLFMVMELLEGITLSQKIGHDGRFAPKVACDIAWQVGEALRYIHSRAIVHGDIKSENIRLLRAPNRRRVVKLLDFGLARAQAALLGNDGRVEGTPHYMAPERIRGEPPSQQSDIYALGILTFELLTGKLPFVGEVEEVFRAHLHAPVPAPSLLLDEPLDERADEIVARATAKDPAARHVDLAVFLYELRTLMNMLGINNARRRSLHEAQPSRVRRIPGRLNEAAMEMFQLAPIPLACVNKHGSVRIANRAFLAFIGVAGNAARIELAHSGLLEVYPSLLDALARCLASRKQIKRVIYLAESDERIVEVAVIMTPVSQAEAPITAGEVHLAFHPLARTDSDSA